jgi:DNA-binding NarL/FixJ family response regulator
MALRTMKRLAIVADNALIVDAVRMGLRDRGMFEFVGYADPRKTSAQALLNATPDAVLVDDMDQSEIVIRLIEELHELDPAMPIFVLIVRMQGRWLERAIDAGARGAISKSVNPVALATLMREALNDHMAHAPATIRPGASGQIEAAAEHSTLTQRELEILQLVAAGTTNGEIARKLWVTEQTVKFHVSNIYRKLEVANRTEACHYAHVNGLLGTTALSAAS